MDDEKKLCMLGFFVKAFNIFHIRLEINYGVYVLKVLSIWMKNWVFLAKVDNFYELELNVEGLNNMKDSLDDGSGIEHPQGEYLYFCASCKA